jgi:DNA-binding NarL/FixJ family response regulator
MCRVGHISETPGKILKVARILIVDDHKVTRERVRHLIEEHAEWSVCGEAENGEEAVEKTAALKPDLIVMDLSMPKMNGLEAARAIHATDPAMRMVLFSINANEPLLGPQLADAGFRGVVNKAEGWLLADAIRHVLAGGIFFQQEGFMGEGARSDVASKAPITDTASGGRTKAPIQTEDAGTASKAAAAGASHCEEAKEPAAGKGLSASSASSASSACSASSGSEQTSAKPETDSEQDPPEQT